MKTPKPRDIEKPYTAAQFAAKLRRLADAVEPGQSFTIEVAGERHRIPTGAKFNIEHERAGAASRNWNFNCAGSELLISPDRSPPPFAPSGWAIDTVQSPLPLVTVIAFTSLSSCAPPWGRAWEYFFSIAENHTPSRELCRHAARSRLLKTGRPLSNYGRALAMIPRCGRAASYVLLGNNARPRFIGRWHVGS